MTELTQGAFKVIASTSLGRALVYTVGHVIIAMNVVYWLTGASLFEAGLVAMVEPCINGCWYYLLDRICTNINK
tara:strand:- start:776 stop:997 length:222 start_codon:yes stop_codon:yes gene_type:complete